MGRAAIDMNGIVKRDGLRCHYCKNLMNIYHNPTLEQIKDPKRFTFEHVVPRSEGGSYGMYNIVGACARCNGEKGNQIYKCFCDFCMNARVRTEMREYV